MNPDQMPVNSQRDERVEVFDRLPSADDIARRTAHKRQELVEPFEKAVAFTTRLAAERIASAADRGQVKAKVEGDDLKNVVKNVAAKRVLRRVADELLKRGFAVDTQGGAFEWEACLHITWKCDTPDYRTAGD